MRRHVAIWTCILGAVLAKPLFVEAQAAKLKAAVVLSGANNTADTMEFQASAGLFSRDLDFYSTASLDPSPSAGRLAVTSLRATTAPGETVAVRASVVNGTATAVDGALFDVSLSTAEVLRIRVTAENLRAGATYSGRLILTALKETREWTFTVTTGAEPILVVDPIGALQFERSLWTWLCSWRSCADPIGEFTFSVRGKTPVGAVTNLHVRFEPSATAASKTLRSNFGIENFDFGAAGDPLRPAPSADAAAAKPSCGTTTLPAANASLDKPAWFNACVSGLEPGEYAGALRFVAAEVSEDAADSKLTLAIHVRDPRLIPIVVLVIGSLIGWFTTKYLAAARKAREMSRVVRILRERSEHLMRAQSGKQGWGFSDESVSSALIKVRVALNKLARLTKGGLPMLVEEAELTRLKDDVEMRLSKLEALRAIRLQIEHVAPIQPTIQRVAGRLLRGCHDLLDEPVFGAGQQTALSDLMEKVKPWGDSSLLFKTYLDALVVRAAAESGSVRANDINEKLQPHVKTLLEAWPNEETIRRDATMETLRLLDDRLEKLSFLAREHKDLSVDAIAEALTKDSGASLRSLFDLVDQEFWKRVATAPERIKLTAERSSTEAFNLVRVDLDIEGIRRSRLLVHPLRFFWTIKEETGQVRTVETEDATLVQYFATPGQAQISAELRWGTEQPIKAAQLVTVKVTGKPDYGGSQLFLQGGVLELIAVGIAMAFAVTTAIQTQYDSTFGSTSQYLALFIWAAGAASGGNILKQLGTNNTPGGQTESTLSARS